ncbi:cadmium ion transporter [Rhizoctonia solani AG-1 IA]|uniref:Cadmium ion transporter n=1 Tax=Thanatephorus cucumeris (strain AG1-IA) TaxID=983506 RepID=L8WX25_THACA|nr:cadmium ion transporter [Rhizoctonia solani AG-1 IA]
MLHDGERTEIGERGVNLSGGQKARINLARVAYFGPDIAFVDDPLSAVDSHVSKHILENCLLSGPLADKTRILVTHQLHVLPYVDEVIFMDNGRIVERGRYSDLVAAGGQFSQLVAEYGVAEQAESKKEGEDTTATAKDDRANEKDTPATKLMQGDERNTGAVGWDAYTSYIRAAGGTLFLGFWTSNHWGLPQGAYMGIYAGLGFATAIFSFMGSFAFAWAGFTASLNLFTGALGGVLGSPMKFFDTTPIGAIIARLSKDIDTLDANLPQAWFQLLSNAFSILGTVALVFYTYAWLGITTPLAHTVNVTYMQVLYRYFSMFYRRTSIEVKRLDSILRSLLYAAFSEALTGLSTIRAYREQPRFVKVSERQIDVENKAYFMTIACQRYLGVRLDFLGNLLILGIGLIAVGFRTSADPSKLGVVLTYALTIQEPPAKLPDDPPQEWPQQGGIDFRNVALRYRDGLPLVLDGLTFDVKPGERVGIVGRTGAGKSSLLTALFRVAPLSGGTIEIDGVNIEKVGIETLRHRLSIIPQDAVLFEGTLRENIDPLKTRTDEHLYSALRRVKLLGPGSGPPPKDSKLHLDNEVRDDSFSAGERQLLALCRALIKDQCKILILDEATSSVDVDTDSMVQQMIQRDFHGKTLLCIAHRLNTIAFYDRVLVMDKGRLKEYDTPLNLFDNPDSQFRAMCDKAGLSRADIVKIRANAEAQLQTAGVMHLRWPGTVRQINLGCSCPYSSGPQVGPRRAETGFSTGEVDFGGTTHAELVEHMAYRTWLQTAAPATLSWRRVTQVSARSLQDKDSGMRGPRCGLGLLTATSCPSLSLGRCNWALDTVDDHLYHISHVPHYDFTKRKTSTLNSSKRAGSLVPSILKSRSSESRDGRRRSHRKCERHNYYVIATSLTHLFTSAVRFLPILDTLLRHALHSRSILHDLRFSPHSARMLSATNHHGSGGFNPTQYVPLCPRTRAQPAVSPPVSQIYIVSYEFPWVIEVNAAVSDPGAHHFVTSGRERHAAEPFVTIYDVMHALWAYLQRPVVESEWSALSSTQRRTIRRTCLSAYAREPSRSYSQGTITSRSRSQKPAKAIASEDRKVVRKIDWLGTYTRFAGLGKDEELIADRIEEPWKRELTWVLALDENEYRYDDAATGVGFSLGTVYNPLSRNSGYSIGNTPHLSPHICATVDTLNNTLDALLHAPNQSAAGPLLGLSSLPLTTLHRKDPRISPWGQTVSPPSEKMHTYISVYARIELELEIEATLAKRRTWFKF